MLTAQPRNKPFVKKESSFALPARLSALVLAGVILMFSSFPISKSVPQIKKIPGQQEVLKFIPATLSEDLLSAESLVQLSFAVFFFIYSIHWLSTLFLFIADILKKSLYIPLFLRNPFYVLTSINAP